MHTFDTSAFSLWEDKGWVGLVRCGTFIFTLFAGEGVKDTHLIIPGSSHLDG